MQVPASGDCVGALEDHGDDRRALHVGEVLREEALVRNVVVVLLEDLLARVPHAACDQVQALGFEAGNDLAREAALELKIQAILNGA